MDIKSLAIGLVVGALSVAAISRSLIPATPPVPPQSQDVLEMVVRYIFNKNDDKFEVFFERGDGTPGTRLNQEALLDPKNPLGERAKGKEIRAGTHAVTFVTKSSPGCINSCVGGKCSKICD